MDSLDDVERAWDLRMSDPQGALRLSTPRCGHPDPEQRARALAAASYATLRIAGAAAAEERLGAILADPGLQHTGRGRVLVVWGTIHLSRSDLPEAIRCFEQGAALLRAAGHEEEAAGSLINIAAAHRRIGDAPRALELLVEAAARFRALRGAYGEAIALLNNAQIQWELGDLAAATPLAERAWDLAGTLQRPSFLAFAQANLGRILAESGALARGTALLEEAVVLAEASGVPQAISESLGHLGVVLVEQDPPRARAVLERGVALVRAQGDAQSICLGLIALGDASPPGEAYRHYADAAELAAASSDPTQAGRAHRAAARCAPDEAAELLHWRAFAVAVEQQADHERSNRLARIQAAALLAEIRTRDEEARARIARLAAAARRDSDLLAVAIHDIRGPLQTALGRADLLSLAGVDTRALLRALERIEQILKLIEREVVGEPLPPTTEALLPLVQAILDERRGAAARKDQTLILEGQAISAPLSADRLFHVLDNLVSNAIKYSPPGSVVTVRVRSAGKAARIEVEDQGPGISPVEADRLFERAVQGQARPTGGERSLGLGLYIARRMIEQQRGRIGVQPGASGALFWVELPLAE